MNAYDMANCLDDNGNSKFEFYNSVANTLRQQADKIAKYEQALHSIANDYHELSEHKIEVQNRNYKKWAREALE